MPRRWAVWTVKACGAFALDRVTLAKRITETCETRVGYGNRRVKARSRDDRAEAAGPNEVRSTDFVQDLPATGRKSRMLTVVDIYSRQGPVLDLRDGQAPAGPFGRCGLSGPAARRLLVFTGPKA